MSLLVTFGDNGPRIPVDKRTVPGTRAAAAFALLRGC